jgi:transcriptional regulator with XRE-family HTH domain
MTMTTTVGDPIKEMAANLTRLRHEQGLSYRVLDHRVARLLGENSPTHETIRNYHDGSLTRPDRIDLGLVIALARIYGVAVNVISPYTAERIATLQRLLSEDTSEQVIPASRCTQVTAGQWPLFERRVTQTLPGLGHVGPDRREPLPVEDEPLDLRRPLVRLAEAS